MRNQSTVQSAIVYGLVVADALAASESGRVEVPVAYTLLAIVAHLCRKRLLTGNGVNVLQVVGSPVVVVVGPEVRLGVGRAGVLELSVAIIVHAVVPLAHKDTSMVLVLLAELELVILVVEGVLNVTPLFGGMVTILLKDHPVAVEGLATVVGSPDDNDPLDIVPVPSVLGEVNIVGGTELGLAAALLVPVRREGPQWGVGTSPVGLAWAVVVQFVDVAVVGSIAAILLAVFVGGAGQASASRKVPLTINAAY